MDKLIGISIDVTQLQKARFVLGKKNNKVGVIPQYANLTLHLRKEPDEFGNVYFIKQGVSKDERAAKVEMPIIGSGKVLVAGDAPSAPRPTTAVAKPADDSGDVPF